MKNKNQRNPLYKDIKEFNIIFLLLIGLILIGISGYSSYAIFSDEISSNNEIKGLVKKQTTGADTIIEKVGTDGLVKDDHPATTQLAATTDYRYTGANPNNYVRFNNETWRIIGVFDVDDGTGKLEKRIKIIRDSLGNIAWDSNNVNDWATASGMNLLNNGDYYNRTGSYATNGLTLDAKSMITDAKWYLGGTLRNTETNASQFYAYERGTEVFSGHQISWVGNVGLMYSSDYGYATSGGTTTNRTTCLAKEMYHWDYSNISDCYKNDWLYDSKTFRDSDFQWTITPYSGNSAIGFNVYETGPMCIGLYGNGNSVNSAGGFRPTVYLKSSIKITNGDGSSTNPYELSI